jgi:hypothetical protein
MEVQHIEFDTKQEMFNYANNNGIELINRDNDDCFIGYNEIIIEMQIKNVPSAYYVVQRFDGKMYFAQERKIISAFLNNSKGDIVNMSIHYDIFKRPEASQIHALNRRCIDLDKYYPTLEGIKKYLWYAKFDSADHSDWPNVDYSHWKFDISGKEVHVRNSLSKNNLENIITKLKMLGIPTILVDINTILSMQKDYVQIYTAQKFIIEEYYISYLTGREYRRNYKISDIPDVYKDKYFR